MFNIFSAKNSLQWAFFFSDCPVLPAADSSVLVPGSAELNPSPIGTVVTYNCDPGFFVDGPTPSVSYSLTCVVSGTTAIWDPAPNTFPGCTQGWQYTFANCRKTFQFENTNSRKKY